MHLVTILVFLYREDLQPPERTFLYPFDTPLCMSWTRQYDVAKTRQAFENVIALLLCWMIALGSFPQACHFAAGALGGGSDFFFSVAAEAPTTEPLTPEESPTESSHSSEMSKVGESISVAEGRRSLRRSKFPQSLRLAAHRGYVAVAAPCQRCGNAVFEHGYRNGLGAPIRC